MRPTVFILILLLSFAFSGCLEDAGSSAGADNFHSIFDTNAFSKEIYPIDMVQTADDGFIILGERRLEDSNFRGIYLLKTDKFGKFQSEIAVADTLVNPIAGISYVNGNVYFVCMGPLDLEGRMVEVDDALQTTSTRRLGVTYPAAASNDGENLILLSYNHEDKEMFLSEHEYDGGAAGRIAAFGIGVGDEVEEPIINHFIRTGRRFPFLVGQLSNGAYYFNGFYNYTFSVVFTDFESIAGVVQGQQDDGGISALQPLGGNRFAASRFNFGDNYFMPNLTIETNAISSAVDLAGYVLPELAANAPVKIQNITIAGESHLVFVGDTKSNQIGLYFYRESDGTFESSRYVGFSNPYKVGTILQTSDGGLAICGTTYLAGRFPRIFLNKLSASELGGQAK